MGLFQKKYTDTSSHAPLYTIGGQSTLLIVGLGNPGKEYDNTRHNAGCIAVNAFVEAHDELGGWVTKKDLSCQITNGTFGPMRVIIIKPTTFMNESGRAVQAVQAFYKVAPNKTVVVHDELDIVFGQIRTRMGGGAAGHNGIKSIISHTGDDFGRVRIGINNAHKPLAETSDFVLKSFNNEELAQLSALTREVETILVETIYRGNIIAETRNFIT
jgi:peptidyl-tRNA hydrolase, PTH1 family